MFVYSVTVDQNAGGKGEREGEKKIRTELNTMRTSKQHQQKRLQLRTKSVAVHVAAMANALLRKVCNPN